MTGETLKLKSELTAVLFGLAKACQNNPKGEETTSLLIKGFSMTMPGDAFTDEQIREMTGKVSREKYRIVPDCMTCANPCGNTSDYEIKMFRLSEENVCAVKYQLLEDLEMIAVLCDQILAAGGSIGPEAEELFYKAPCMLSYDLMEETYVNLRDEMAKTGMQCRIMMEKLYEQI